MNILFVVPYVPSLVRVRPLQLIQHLAARGHQVTLATIWTSDAERRELDALDACCADVKSVRLPAWRSLLNCVRAAAGDEPLQARYSWSPALASMIRDEMSRVDLVHVEHLRGARYGTSLDLTRTPRSVPVVWDSVDCISDLFEQAALERGDLFGRLVNRFELGRTRRYEGRMVAAFDRVLVTSATDKASLLALAERESREATRSGKVTVLPNGVDLEYFSPSAEDRSADTLVFSGKMSYHANERAVLHLIRNVMPLVWARRRSTRLVVVGKDPSKALRDAAAVAPGSVTVTGTVPDMRPYLRRAAAAVVPLVYGVGCQNKVLEAMACATPVVATPRAVSALHARTGRDVLTAESAEAFATEVVDLLASPARRREIGESGRRYVETHHRWETVAGNLERVYEDAIGERCPTPRPGDLRHAGTRSTDTAAAVLHA